ncbi:hypothetical protein DYB32_002417 [Aphanomyces invadans]|uniref:Tudor domain-containing protein n=1 Tax=Aphanomyces invadans TaxID=157072 RepID=A0A418B3V9_9STRA|nr:hypothetical protein DYB32_002417 [Aphanomyces invadans]
MAHDPDEGLSLLSPQQLRDLATLHALVESECGTFYSKGDLVLTLREVNWDTAKAFRMLRNREEATKKRTRLPDGFHDTWNRPKNPRLSLPPNHRLFHEKNDSFTPLQAARELDARNAVVSASAPAHFDASPSEYNLPYSQKHLSPPSEEVENDDDDLDSSTQLPLHECDPTAAANLLSLHLSNRANPIKDEAASAPQSPPLDEVFTKLAVAWSPDVKNLLDAACAAHAAALRHNSPTFDATEASNLLLDIVSLLPHVQRLDALDGRITPTDAEVAASDKAAMLDAMAPLVAPEDKIKALNAACTNHTRRLQAFCKAKADLAAMHADTLHRLKTKLADVTELVQRGQKHVAEMAAELNKARTDEVVAAKKLQELVLARRAEYIATGVPGDAALIRAQTNVFTTQIEVDAVTARELHAAAERATTAATEAWDCANLVDVFGIAAQALVRYVVALRQETMTQAFNDFYVMEARAKTASGARLKEVLPRVVAELVSFDAALILRVRHATSEANLERNKLKEHDMRMGTSAPTRRKNILETIAEFENAVTLSKELMDETATAQDAQWTALLEVAPTTDVATLLESECATHWRDVEGPLRDVFLKFAKSSDQPNDAFPPPTAAATLVATEPTALGSEESVRHVEPPTSTALTTTSSFAFPPSKYQVGDIMYTRFNEHEFLRCRVLAYVPAEAKYTMEYEDGSVYHVSEKHLFTEAEYARVAAAMTADEPDKPSTCAIM